MFITVAIMQLAVTFHHLLRFCLVNYNVLTSAVSLYQVTLTVDLFVSTHLAQ